jgi:hemolysin activation/secretion protein
LAKGDCYKPDPFIPFKTMRPFPVGKPCPVSPHSLWWLACLWLTLTALHAQTPPNAGVLEQGIHQGRSNTPNLKPPASLVLPTVPQVTSQTGTMLTVSRFKFVGSTVFPEAMLHNVTAAWLGRPIDFGQLSAATAAVGNLYRAAGHVVQVQIPVQDIREGVVMIDIVEAQFGQVVMEGAGPQRVDPQRIKDTLYAFQPSGQLLNAHNIDRGLSVIADLAGVQVETSFNPGQQAGQTDLMVWSANTPAWQASVEADNAGSRSTGQDRVAAQWQVNSPLRQGDQMVVHTLWSQGSQYLRLAHAFPLGVRGWRAGWSLSHLNYRVISSDFSAQSLKGKADSLGLESTYPLWWTRYAKVNAMLNADSKRLLNQEDAQTASSYGIQIASAGLGGTLSPAGGVWGTTHWQYMGKRGVLSAHTDLRDTLRAGRFNKQTYALTHDQSLSPRMSWQLSLQGQSAKTALDSSEQFYLGGMNGVRAYPSSEAGGASGQLWRLEWRYRLNNQSTWFAFHDHGRVVVDPASSSALNTLVLKGRGVGYGYVSQRGIRVKAMWARRIGSNPHPSATLQDQDGSLVLNRFWLSASVPF